MSFIVLFKTTLMAMLEIFLLGACGFFLIKKKFINEEGLRVLTKLVIEIILPVFIFSQFIQKFSFSLFRNWLVFPFLSLIISLLGLGIGIIFLKIFKISTDRHEKREFLSLLMFQNSGYLPLILSATLFPEDMAAEMFIYIFLFLLGFNLAIWSFGVWFLRGHSIKHFELGSLFSPPVLAIIISLLIIFFKIDRIIPQVIINTSSMLGKCTLPLAMIVVGGNLALIPITKMINKRAVSSVLLTKLFVLPLLALLILLYFRTSGYIGFLLILETAVPCATSLSLITRHYQLEDRLINQGIFFTHICSLVTIPIFLCLYLMFAF
ncbi:MAG: AEC family transporter [Candidatus Omnitrophica bacterium]|nr:AEC family transporter [Candidatus Omnitrophota bacterium]